MSLAATKLSVTNDTEALALLRNRGVLNVGSDGHRLDLLLLYGELALRLGRPVEAGWALHFANETQEHQKPLPQSLLLPNLLHHPVWCSPLQGRTVKLIQPHERHRTFLGQLLETPSFVQRYNSFIGHGKSAVDSFLQRTQQAPLQTRQIDWLATTLQGVPLGLASLADIDLENQRAELLIGFPDLPAMRQKMVESALLLFVAAFAYLNLQKLVSFVYDDNLPAQEAALHFGFQREGVLRSHVRHRQYGKRVDLHVFGLLRKDFFDNSYLRQIGRRIVTPHFPLGCMKLNLDHNQIG